MSSELTRRELAALLGAGALSRVVSSEEGQPVVLPGVVGLGGAEAKLGQTLGGAAARRAVGAALAGAVGASVPLFFHWCRYSRSFFG